MAMAVLAVEVYNYYAYAQAETLAMIYHMTKLTTQDLRFVYYYTIYQQLCMHVCICTHSASQLLQWFSVDKLTNSCWGRMCETESGYGDVLHQPRRGGNISSLQHTQI